MSSIIASIILLVYNISAKYKLEQATDTNKLCMKVRSTLFLNYPIFTASVDKCCY